ncbi:MAG TPA: nucleoside-diphosphate sugar epimerase/dehydratase [Spongiibacteraceae bacterium]|jgi:FlaA1/EpsC-like NDP-sugar epimerase
MDTEAGSANVVRSATLVDRIYGLPRRSKQCILIAFDLCAIPLAVWLAVALRWGGMVFEFTEREALAIFVTVAVSGCIFIRTGLYRAMVRYMGQQAITTVVKDVTWSSFILAIALFVFRSEVPRSAPLIYWAIALFFIGGGRLMVRASYQNMRRWTGKKVAIYGAGTSGRQLLHSVFQSGEFAPMVFLDDSHNLQGTVINGIPVYDPRELPHLIADMDITHVLLALPDIDRMHKRKIIDYLTQLPLHVKTIPSFSALASGIAQVGDVVDVDVEDLLGRETVPPQPSLLTKCIADKIVLVTGAGGSIGSELCRQILSCLPSELILLDASEYNLYTIHRELVDICAAKNLDIPIVPLLGNVQNERKMRGLFAHFKVQTVYHAAAYKHVPIVEHNISEGIENNVFGTLATTRAAALAGVETFVLISTDKAVRPTNIMGASKRVAELIVQACARRYPHTNHCVVRFGNVLGSSGSVVPLFREQINKGGPVTVTHPEVQRYFMTIPEAAQLVLQAGAMGGQGDVFVLDMGEPVYIVDLARRMIKLMGHVEKSVDHLEGDIEIQFIGLRPGEKLVEELLLGNATVGTGHAKILRAQEEWLAEEPLQESLTALRQAINTENIAVVQVILEEIVKGFGPNKTVQDAIWKKRAESGTATGNVYSLFGGDKSTAGAE